MQCAVEEPKKSNTQSIDESRKSKMQSVEESRKSKTQNAEESKKSSVISRKKYLIIKRLGQGAFGTVYKAKRMEFPDQLAAVKVMDLNKMSEHYKEKFLPREMETLIDCKHDNIIQVFDIIRSNYKLYVFMEFAENGDILDYAKKNNGIKPEIAACWFYQITLGLQYLHEVTKTAHRDIKLDNFLLSSKWEAKLTDFGFASMSSDANNNVVLAKTYCGTAPYYAPRVLRRLPYDPFKADVFSMGVSLYTMLNNRFPFHFKDATEHYKEMVTFPAYIRSRFVETTPKECRPLLESMLDPDDKIRITSKDILNNDWLKNTARLCEFYVHKSGMQSGPIE